MPCLDEFCLFNGHFGEHTLLAAGLGAKQCLALALELCSGVHMVDELWSLKGIGSIVGGGGGYGT